MTRFLIRLLAVFGLAPARTVASQARLIEELRAGSVSWKTRATEAQTRAKVLEAELRDQKKISHRAAAAIEKSQLKHAAFEALKERLASAELELTAAREHLMTIEVKLDILEGAANVLDLRTRRTHAETPSHPRAASLSTER